MYKYSEAVDFVYGLGQNISIPSDLGLKKIENLLKIIGNPQNSFDTIHITGTKGKGSTAMFLNSILKNVFKNVGLYISPSLINVSERISINSALIPPSIFVSYIRELEAIYRSVPLDIKPSIFDTFTIAAFMYFRDQNVDLSIIEVGLGGRLDSTNILKRPLISIITEISFDHQNILGKTLKEIAYEKAGIIKRNSIVVTGVDDKEALNLICSISKKQNSSCFVLGKDFEVKNVRICEEFSVFDFISYVSSKSFKDIKINIIGNHQVKNAAVAIQSVLLLDNKSLKIEPEAIYKGSYNAFWPGRFEVVSSDPFIVLDGAHNNASAEALADTLKLFNKKKTFLFSMLTDKNIDAVLMAIAAILNKLYITEVPFSFSRRLDANYIATIARKYIDKTKITVIKDPRKAYFTAKRHLSDDELLCVTGSLYLVGFIREINKIFTFSGDML